MLKKILLERDFIPDNLFDWSLSPVENFKKVNPEDYHSSISSDGIPDEQGPNMKENIQCYDRQRNIKKIKDRYQTDKILPKNHMKTLNMPKNCKYDKTRESFSNPEDSMIKFGDYQYISKENLNQYL